jgi:hypothetical protein
MQDILHTCLFRDIMQDILHTCLFRDIMQDILHTCLYIDIMQDILHTCLYIDIMQDILHVSLHRHNVRYSTHVSFQRHNARYSTHVSLHRHNARYSTHVFLHRHNATYSTHVSLHIHDHSATAERNYVTCSVLPNPHLKPYEQPAASFSFFTIAKLNPLKLSELSIEHGAICLRTELDYTRQGVRPQLQGATECRPTLQGSFSHVFCVNAKESRKKVLFMRSGALVAGGDAVYFGSSYLHIVKR